MKFDTDVPQGKARPRLRYDFDQVTDGASVHVIDDGERCRVMAAFKGWVTRNPSSHGRAVSRRVGISDPRGPGFRIWFNISDQYQRPEPIEW